MEGKPDSYFIRTASTLSFFKTFQITNKRACQYNDEQCIWIHLLSKSTVESFFKIKLLEQKDLSWQQQFEYFHDN